MMLIKKAYWDNYKEYLFYTNWKDWRKAQTVAWALWGDPGRTEHIGSACSV